MEDNENKIEEVAEEIKAEAAEGKAAFEEKKAELQDKAEELRDKIVDKAEDISEKLSDKADEIKEELKEKAADLKEDFKEDFQEKKEELKEKAAETKEKIKEKINEMEAESAAADANATYTEDEVRNGTLMGILAYLGILNLIPFFVEKENKFVRFHTVQGFTLLIIWVILVVIDALTGKFLNFVFNTLEFLVGIWAIIGIVNVIKGEAKELPLIGKYRFIK
ncbi:MAG: YtxH domain-containing protein [Bacteroidales bacterium]|nr:YtxH domain-containing protein [Candidatus Equibacterium intestinale]